MKKTTLPILLMFFFAAVFYIISYFTQEYDIFSILLDAAFNLVIAFFFGFLILGLLGIACTKLFFLTQRLFSRQQATSGKYIMLKTKAVVTGTLIVKRAFLLYCIAISLTLTTIQAIGFIDPAFISNFGTSRGDIAPFQETFSLIYTILVFSYAAAMTIILPPIWYLDDVNLMFFTENEGVRYLNPIGQSVLPALKGFGSFNIIIAYLIFVISRFTISASLITMLDPILTLFEPIMFLLGFEAISAFGKKDIRAWLVKKGIQSFDEMHIELVKSAGDYRFKVDGVASKPEPSEGNKEKSPSTPGPSK